MYSAPFEYYRATSLEHALELLRANPDARLLAGGHSLLPQMKLRVASPPALVDISRLSGLAGVTLDGAQVRLGALTTHDALARSAVLHEHCPIVSEAAAQIGDQQVRNRGTLGGSLAHADPAADLPTVMLALEATLTTTGPGGQREIAAAGWCRDLFTTDLQPGEILTSVSVPAYGSGTGGCYAKHEHPAPGYAVVGAAALVTLRDGKIAEARLAIGGATAIPVRATAAEASLVGQEPAPAAMDAASRLVPEALTDLLDEPYASSAYRRQLATVLARRALTQAAARAG
jgi:carbon-monoxide dehydrogenase medium subunit